MSLSRNVVGEWVRTRRVGNPTAKLILQLLFDRSSEQEDGRWVMWAALGELAWEACLADGENGIRTVRKHILDLEKAGLITREARSRENGSTTSSRIVLHVDPSEIPDRADRRARPDSGVRTPRIAESGGPGLHSPDQKPHTEAPTGSPTQDETRAGARVDADLVPDDFPDALRPHARSVMRILKATAADHGSRKVTARHLALSMLANPNRRYVSEALKLRAWAAGAKKPPRNVVATYGNWLGNADPIEGIELLDVDGQPVQRTGSAPGRRMSNAEHVDANDAALRAFAEAGGQL